MARQRRSNVRFGFIKVMAHQALTRDVFFPGIPSLGWKPDAGFRAIPLFAKKATNQDILRHERRILRARTQRRREEVER